MNLRPSKFRRQVQTCRERMQEGTLAFTDCLTGDLVTRAIERCRIEFRDRVYTPWITVWLFLYQVMTLTACADVVSHFILHLTNTGQEPCSPDTGAYCGARNRLPLDFYRFICLTLGREAHNQAPSQWKFFGRNVKVVDGTTVSMPETKRNCAEFPLEDPMRAGLSFPLVRMLVTFSLSVGTIVEVALAPYRGKQSGEYSLLRQAVEAFEKGDIFLADAGFCSYCHLAELHQRGVDSVVKAEWSRLVNLVEVKKLGKHDVLYRWRKPKGKPETFERQEFDSLPDEMLVRIVTLRVVQEGFRTIQFDVLTTLTDHKEFPATEIAGLFRRRWQAELFIRDIKCTLRMDFLKCQTAEMVRKEIYAHLTAYNIVRIHMAQAAQLAGLSPEQISFTSSLRTLAQAPAAFKEITSEHTAVLLALISHRRVAKQPDRIEPRAVKRRQPHAYLTKPRAEARKTCNKKP